MQKMFRLSAFMALKYTLGGRLSSIPSWSLSNSCTISTARRIFSGDVSYVMVKLWIWRRFGRLLILRIKSPESLPLGMVTRCPSNVRCLVHMMPISSTVPSEPL